MKKRLEFMEFPDDPLERVLLILIYSFVIANTLSFFILAFISLKFNYSLDYVEGIILSQTWQLIHGKLFYAPISNTLGIPAVYPPFYHVILAMCYKLLHLNTPVQLLHLARAITITSTILVVLLLIKIVSTRQKSLNPITLVFLLSIFGFPEFRFWTLIVRMDIVGILLSLLGLYLFFQEKRWWAYLMFSLAISTKPTFISALISTWIYMIFLGKISKIQKVKEAFINLIFVGIPHIFLNILTSGQYAYAIIVNNRYNLYSTARIFKRVVYLGYEYWIFILMVAMTLILISTKLKEMDIFDIYPIVSFGIAIVASGKAGAATNHILEFLVASILEGSYFFSYLYEKAKNLGSYGLARTLTCFVLLLLLIPNTFFLLGTTTSNLWLNLWFRDKFIIMNYKEEPIYKIMIKEINQKCHGKEVFSEDAYIALITNSTPVDIFVLTQLYHFRLWNQSVLVDKLKNKEFCIVILEGSISSKEKYTMESRYTPEMINAIKQNYNFSKSYGRFSVYEPKNE